MLVTCNVRLNIFDPAIADYCNNDKASVTDMMQQGSVLHGDICICQQHRVFMDLALNWYWIVCL